MTAVADFGTWLQVPFAGMDVVARRLGSGPVVLALHGGLGLSHDYLVPAAQDLADAAGTCVVLPDLPGNGRSRPAAYPDMDGYADSCIAVLDALDAPNAVLLGHSYGGFVALQTALRHRARVAGLVLLATSAAMDHWDAIHARLRSRADLPSCARRGFEAEPFVDSADYAAWLRDALPLYLPAGVASDVVTPLRLDLVDLDVMQHGARLQAAWDVRHRLAEIDLPALVVTGQDDVLMAPVHDVLASGLRHARSWFPGRTGHFPHDERRAEFVARTTSWLREEVGWSSPRHDGPRPGPGDLPRAPGHPSRPLTTRPAPQPGGRGRFAARDPGGGAGASSAEMR